jgi:WD40 repeat protein
MTIASGSHDGTIRLWDVSNRGRIGENSTKKVHFVSSVLMAPDGKVLYFKSYDGIVKRDNNGVEYRE